MKTLAIGDLARASGLTVEAIRYYEMQSLLEKPPRSVSGYRQYSPDAVKKLNFICKAKELGFSLTEIRELLHLCANTVESCAHVKAKADLKINVIRGKIIELQRLQNALTTLSARCSENNLQKGKCPILDLLE